MPTPPFLIPSNSVDLTLPGNALRAAVRVSARPGNTIALDEEGRVAQTWRGDRILARRVVDQEAQLPAFDLPVEWDSVDATSDEFWNPLDPAYVFLRAGVWAGSFLWSIAQVDGFTSTGGSAQDTLAQVSGARLLGEFGAVPWEHVYRSSSVSGEDNVLLYSAFKSGADGPWMQGSAPYRRVSQLDGFQTVLNGQWCGYFRVRAAQRFALAITSATTSSVKARIPGTNSGVVSGTFDRYNDRPAAMALHYIAAT